jgi:hypothetical protein
MLTTPFCHCRSEARALSLRQALEARLAACKLELHPQKTKIVYCKDSNRPDCYPEHRFDFLGFTFRPRLSMNRAGKLAHMPTAAKADAASCCVIERNPERSRFQLTNRIKRSRCAGPFHNAVHMNAPSPRVKSIEKPLGPRAVPHMRLAGDALRERELTSDRHRQKNY